MPFNDTGTITLKLLAQDLASGNVGKFIGHMDTMAKKGGLMGSVMQGVGQSFGQMLNPVGLVTSAIGTATQFMGDSISAASDQAEALSKVTVVFGEQADEIAKWAKTAATSMGMSETAALSAAGTLGNLFDGLGIADDAALDMSKSITQLAADLGSFNNVATDEALLALRSGLLGEAEPMRKFGSALSAARVDAYGFANGLETVAQAAGSKLKPQLTEAAKVQARYALMLQDTKNAQGDFARTSDGLANSQKTLDAQVQDLTATFGRLLEGPAKGFVGFLSGIVDVLDGPTGATQQILSLADSVTALTEAAKDERTALQLSQEQYQKTRDSIGLLELNYSRMAGEMVNAAGADTIAMLTKFKGVGVDTFYALASRVNEAGGDFSDFQALLEGLARETVPGANLLTDAWTGALSDMGDAAVEEGHTIYGGLVRPVKRAFSAMFSTMADQKEPWKSAWKEMARYAKDPFRPAAFENWLGKRADKAAEKAAQAAADGKPAVARRWQALSDVMSKPVLAALATTQDEIDALVAAMQTVSLVTASTGGYRRNGSTGSTYGRGGGVGRARGGPVAAGGVYRVGEEAEETLVMGPNGGGYVIPHSSGGRSSGGTTVIVNFNSVTPPTEADGQRVARMLVPHIRREMGRAGA